MKVSINLGFGDLDTALAVLIDYAEYLNDTAKKYSNSPNVVNGLNNARNSVLRARSELLQIPQKDPRIEIETDTAKLIARLAEKKRSELYDKAKELNAQSDTLKIDIILTIPNIMRSSRTLKRALKI